MAQAALRTTTNRRVFLVGTTAILATASGASGHTPDPILAAIDDHKKSAARYNASLKRRYRLETTLPKDRRKTLRSSDEVVETDDPRWIETMTQMDDADEEMLDFARALLNTDITTAAGLIAFLDHVASSTTEDDFMFPEYVDEDEEEAFAGAAMLHLRAALIKIMV